MPSRTQTLIIGAGPAGLSCAACLSRAGLEYTVLERADAVGSSWRNHYHRLHLHTERQLSNLPHLAMPEHFPKYPSRRQVIEYLEEYAEHFDIRPHFGQTVERAYRDGGRWRIRTADGEWLADHLVVATGYNAVPNEPAFPGQAEFAGEVMHSSRYDNGARWRGKPVLVVGCGNSGGEIALDLVEYGAEVSWVVRGPVYVVPRDTFGRSAQRMSLLMSRLPRGLADAISTRLQRIVVGDLSEYGLRRPRDGMYTLIQQHGRIPILDIGTIEQVKKGRIRVVPAIDRFTATGVAFADGRASRFDLVILATGFRSGLHAFLDGAAAVTDARGYPVDHGRETALPGLYFIGHRNTSTGVLREMAFEGQRIARSIAAKAAARTAAAPAADPARPGQRRTTART